MDEENSAEQWIVLNDVTFSPARGGVAEADKIKMSDANVQLSQIIALDLDMG